MLFKFVTLNVRLKLNTKSFNSCLRKISPKLLDYALSGWYIGFKRHKK